MSLSASARKPAIASHPELPILFANEYRGVRPLAPIPAFDVRFRRFTSLNTTIRLREGVFRVRLSDALEDAPESVHRAIAHILIAKLYRKPVATAKAETYREYITSEAVAQVAQEMRQTRGRKRLTSPVGRYWDLEEVYGAINRRFFGDTLVQPVLTWSAHAARRMLGHYDAAHNTIVVSRVFDRAKTPRCAIEYLLYHEMLHQKHPVTIKDGRRCVHSREFQADERLFPELAGAREFLKTL